MTIRILTFVLTLLVVSTVLALDFDYDGLKLGSSLTSLSKTKYRCSPAAILQDKTECKRNDAGKFLGIPVKKVELMYKKDRLYIIFIGIDPNNVASVRTALVQKYGNPKTEKQVLKGVYQITWEKGDTEVVLNKDSKRNTADVTMMSYK